MTELAAAGSGWFGEEWSGRNLIPYPIVLFIYNLFN
jgi:hypothetical protein